MSTVSIVRAVEDRFEYHRQDYKLDPDGSPEYIFELPFEGTVCLQREGVSGEGPWGVDFWHPDRPVSPAEVRRWAHALLGAADLAESFNAEGLES